MTGDERRVIWAVLTYTARLAGRGAPNAVRHAGARIVVQLSGSRVSQESALAGIDDAMNHAVTTDAFDAETRLLLLRATAALCEAAGGLSDALVAEACAISRELGFDAETMRQLLGISQPGASGALPSTPDGDTDAACAVLGVSLSASVFEIKKRYRALLIQFHPDHAASNGIDEATATDMTQKINLAYEVLMGAQRVKAA
jgi:DnaJ-domain-containing protein 1